MTLKKLLLFALISGTTLLTKAQQTPLQKYEIAPAHYEHVFLDKVEDYPSRLTTSDGGQYLGQTDDRIGIYGYGTFISNDGTQRTGQFRKGDFMFGITLTDKNATVGSKDFYATYDLATGKLEYIFKVHEKQLIDAEGFNDYAFVTQTYTNGDRYIGETYKGKRHGYGIYYYADGDYWYGQYKNDVRCGFGALFTTSNEMFIGEWNIEDIARLIIVTPKLQ